MIQLNIRGDITIRFSVQQSDFSNAAYEHVSSTTWNLGALLERVVRPVWYMVGVLDPGLHIGLTKLRVLL